MTSGRALRDHTVEKLLLAHRVVLVQLCMMLRQIAAIAKSELCFLSALDVQ